MDITSATIASLIAATTSALVSVLIAKNNRKRELSNQLDSILKIAVQYPYLESDNYTSSWSSSNSNNEDAIRYDLYCTLVFNHLSQVSHFYNFRKDKIEGHIAIKPWVRQHGRYWHDPITPNENIDQYDERFVQVIETYLQGAKL